MYDFGRVWVLRRNELRLKLRLECGKLFFVLGDGGVLLKHFGDCRAELRFIAPVWADDLLIEFEDYYQELDAFQQQYAADIEDLDARKEEDEELYDEYMALKKASEDHPISESAVRGGKLFFSEKAGCTACHLGANFTDEKYHNLGVGMEAKEPDLGRFVVTNVEADKGAFKTPTCRNVAQTAPYMHDGSQATLEEVVEWYAKGGHPNQWLSEKVKKLDLTDQDKADLVAFMKEGLTGELPKVEEGRLLPDAEVAKEKAEEELKEEKAEAKAA